MSVKTKNSEYTFEYAVRLNQWSMRLLGLWPLDTRLSTLKWSIGFVTALAFLLPSMAYLITLTNSELIIEQTVMTIPLFLLMIKLFYIRAKSRNFKIILNAMIDDWNKYRKLPNWGKRIMIRYAKIGRQVNVICIACMALSVLGYMSLPSGRKDTDDNTENVTFRKLPTPGLYPFDSEKSPNYEILYTSQAIVSFLYAMVTFSLDCFLSVILFHACGQFSILTEILENYGKHTKHVLKENRSMCVCACLKCIVRRHVSIINYMEIVGKSFNEFVLLQVTGNSLVFATEGYLLVAYAEDSDAWGFLTFVVYTTTVTYNIFIYCYIGECVIGKFLSAAMRFSQCNSFILCEWNLRKSKSEEVGSTAYNLAWIDLPRHLARPLILLMIRSGRPCTISAGGFVTISLSYYKNILTTAMSYISVLRAIR